MNRELVLLALSALSREELFDLFMLLVKTAPEYLTAAEIANNLGLDEGTAAARLEALAMSCLVQHRGTGATAAIRIDLVSYSLMLDYLKGMSAPQAVHPAQDIICLKTTEVARDPSYGLHPLPVQHPSETGPVATAVDASPSPLISDDDGAAGWIGVHDADDIRQ